MGPFPAEGAPLLCGVCAVRSGLGTGRRLGLALAAGALIPVRAETAEAATAAGLAMRVCGVFSAVPAAAFVCGVFRSDASLWCATRDVLVLLASGVRRESATDTRPFLAGVGAADNLGMREGARATPSEASCPGGSFSSLFLFVGVEATMEDILMRN